MNFILRPSSLLLFVLAFIPVLASAQSACDEHLRTYYEEVRQAIKNGITDYQSALTDKELENMAERLSKASLAELRRALPAFREDVVGASKYGGFGEEPKTKHRLCVAEARIAELEAKAKMNQTSNNRPTSPAEPIDCVFLDFPDGRAVFTNKCPFKVNISYCIQKEKGFFRCKGVPQRADAQFSLSTGKTHSIQNYKSEGGGRVYPTYCAFPEAAREFAVLDGNRIEWECRK